MLMAPPALGISAEYRITPNGTSYFASVQIQDQERFDFYETGLLGERVPTQVGGISLAGECIPCTFNWTMPAAITFPKGNYTLHYQGQLRENHLAAMFDRPYRVVMVLPEGFDVRNPALGVVSQGGEITSAAGNTTIVTWNSTRAAEIRFYDRQREELLAIFLNFWIIIAVVLLFPFLLTWRRKK